MNDLQVIEMQERSLAVQEREFALLDRKMELEAKKLKRAEFWAAKLASSDLVPKDFRNNPANCFIAIQWGEEIGLAPLQSTQNIAVINGRPALWGDALPALVKASKQCEYISLTCENNIATCKVKRVGEPEHTVIFSKAMAEKARLWGKAGPWCDYPERMLQNRARAFALRDTFPDVLKGLYTVEELDDSRLPISMGNAEIVELPVAQNQIAGTATFEFYSDEKFNSNAPKWQALVESGKKSATDLIAFLGTKENLTDEQKATIQSWTLPVDNENQGE